MTQQRAGIALGSNLGDRLANLRASFSELRDIATPGSLVLKASIYQTEPLHCPAGSPRFLNTVIEIGYNGSPQALLEQTRDIELRLGRKRDAERNAPRVIDIDLLYLGDNALENEHLTLPHPRLRARRFVLQPLCNIRPELILPGETHSVAEWLGQLPGEEPPLLRIDETL